MTGRLLYLYFRVTNCAMFVRKKLEFRVSVGRVSVGGVGLVIKRSRVRSPARARLLTTTLGKLFTPNYLDAGTPR